MAEEYFDPRKHSAVTLRITEKVHGDFAGNMELPVKTYYVGPQKRPSTAPASREGPPKPAMAPGPEYLNKDGTWSLKAPVNNLEQRSLAETISTLPGGRDIAPVAAVHSYADSSPVVTADYTHELPPDYTRRPHTVTDFRSTRGQKQTEYSSEYLGNEMVGGKVITEAWSPSEATSTIGRQTQGRSSSVGPRASAQGVDTLNATKGRIGVSEGGANATMGRSGGAGGTVHKTKVTPGTGTLRGQDGTWRSMSNPRQRPHSASATYTTKAPRKNIHWDGKQHHVANPAPGEYEELPGGPNGPELTSRDTRPPSYSFNRTTARLGASQNVTGKMWSPATLCIKDLNREVSLGMSVSPCSPNAKLVGGRWRHIPRAATGDVVYTDYYGRYGAEANNYYGRGYTVDPRQHMANRVLPQNNEYDRVRASIPGIETLRNKAGLVLKSTIVNGPTDLLPEPEARLHKISDTYRLSPATERGMRDAGRD